MIGLEGGVLPENSCVRVLRRSCGVNERTNLESEYVDETRLKYHWLRHAEVLERRRREAKGDGDERHRLGGGGDGARGAGATR